MKIITTKKKTRHIIAYLGGFIQFGIEDKFIEYDFFYFNFCKFTEGEIKKFRKGYSKGKLRVNRFPIPIHGFLLKHSDIEALEEREDSCLEHFRYDSLNHLNSKPTFEKNDDYYEISGHLLCNLDCFIIEVERIPDTSRVPIIIYRNIFPYSRLMDNIPYRY
jgi:hypothetical protein